MAKLYGLSGKATGKKGDTVFAVRNGEQIIRQYNPIVSNPKTVAQTDNRAKLKLLSQLAAVVSPVIAISRRGAVSPRNRFTSVNYPSVSAAQGVADIKLENLQITDSHVGMADFHVAREAGHPLAVALDSNAAASFSRVVYVLVEVNEKKEIRVADSQVVSVAGSAGTFPTTLTDNGNDCVILAYGMSDVNGRAKAVLGNIEGDGANMVAQLVANRTVSMSDTTLTETLGLALAAGAASADTADNE